MGIKLNPSMLNIFFKKAIILHVQIKKNLTFLIGLLCTIKNSLFFVVCALTIKKGFKKK